VTHIKSPDNYFLLLWNSLTYMSFWELISAYPNGGQWALSAKFCPPWLKPLVTLLLVGMGVGKIFFQGDKSNSGKIST